MEVFYKGNSGQILDFTKAPYRMLKDTDLLDYSWEYETRKIKKKVSRFHRGIITKGIKVSITGETPAAQRRAYEKLLSVVENDISGLSPGRFYVNDMYLSCYVVANQKEKIEKQAGMMVCSFTLLSESGNWIKEEHNNFNASQSAVFSEGGGLNYPYAYPYDYANSSINKLLYNNNYAAADFEMTIFGTCSNPVISIGELVYEVTADIALGEYLVINTLEKKIYKVKVSGEKVNLFHYRSRERSNFFEKIPPGKHNILWNGSYTFDIDLFYERSEPKWI